MLTLWWGQIYINKSIAYPLFLYKFTNYIVKFAMKIILNVIIRSLELKFLIRETKTSFKCEVA